jgi:hypothetical protein
MLYLVYPFVTFFVMMSDGMLSVIMVNVMAPIFQPVPVGTSFEDKNK